MILVGALALLVQAPGFPCVFDEARLVAHDPEGGDMFGQSVARSGATIVVGAGGEDEAGIDAGAAYVYVLTASQWVEAAKWTASDGAAGDRFGGSVGLDGDTAVVGARFHDAAGPDAGAAYVFVRQGTLWNETAKLVANDASAHSEFGRSVAVIGDTLVVGAPGESSAGNDAGALYVFERSGTSWSQSAKLVASNATSGDVFGTSLAFDGSRCVSGAPLAPPGGAAYVFVRGAPAWSEEAVLFASDGAGGDRFGHSVSLAAGVALIGAPLNDSRGVDAGAAYVFARNGALWSETAKLLAHDAAAQDLFGWSVACAPQAALIGAVWDDDVGDKSGSVYVFESGGGAWTESLKAVAADGGAGHSFGVSTDLEADALVVGAYQSSIAGPGWAYVLRSPGPPQSYCTAKLNSCGSLPGIAASGSSSAAAAAGFAVHVDQARALKSGLLLYSDSGPNAAPFLGAWLCVDTAGLRRSVAVSDTSGTPGLCDGRLAIDMNAFARGLLGGNPSASLTLPGTPIHCQFWGRDTLANGSLLSDGLRYVVCP